MLWSLARWNLLFMYLSGPKRLKYIHTYIFLYTRNGILWQFLFPLGNQVPLVMGNFQMLAFICQVWHPPSPPKFKTYFLNRKKATETGMSESIGQGCPSPAADFRIAALTNCFFRCTHLHCGFRYIHDSCKFLSEGTKSQMFSVWTSG